MLNHCVLAIGVQIRAGSCGVETLLALDRNGGLVIVLAGAQGTGVAVGTYLHLIELAIEGWDDNVTGKLACTHGACVTKFILHTNDPLAEDADLTGGRHLDGDTGGRDAIVVSQLEGDAA